MIFEVGYWKVEKSKSKNHLEIMKKSVAFQRENRSRLLFTKSQFYKVESKNPDVEVWSFIDEYPDRETYDKWLEIAPVMEIEMAEILQEWGEIIVPDSFKIEVWTSHPNLYA